MDKLKLERKFVSKDLKIENWKSVKEYYKTLENKKLNSIEDIKEWLVNRGELEAVLEEDLAWRYIKMSCDTTNKDLSEAFNLFVTEIEPEISKKSNILDKKIYNTPLLNELDKDKYFVFIRELKKEIEIFRENNVPIFAELQKEEQEYGAISAEMTINYKGEEITLHKAANYLKDVDRTIREEVYKLISERRLKDVEKLNELLDRLIKKREQISKNADYKNFRDYKFTSLGRFDYSVTDCENFHNAISKSVSPLIEEIHQQRKEKLGYDNLKPWDLSVDVDLKPALKPYNNSDDLIEKTIKCFTKIRPKYGEFISIMRDLKYLDLDARKGKAPGGFNYPLYESNVPFIFMNSTENLRDLVTMVHEGGHAIHSFLTKDIELLNYKELASEVAELASMSMELISMEHWDFFFDDKEELKRAKKTHLEDVLTVLPWVATVDKFQHWLYVNPTHSVKEREEAWNNIFNEFGSKTIDWSSFEKAKTYTWQKQLHIYEVPFYYIEYAISQLGAIAIWKNFKQNPEKALDQYEEALKLGYSKPIPEIYKTAGIKFDFSEEYVKELMQFVSDELKQLQ